eukprot:TRINITY_DN49607_c0_g1_i1.p1 TRINITY_DN49607_c0_g1~~TRINITY_DN49607_c0_g1_i1.p1  ORF type:complete len:750 (+),score=116.18 TRINITY_DN49607_c0_g1_i1:82-2331(+)
MFRFVFVDVLFVWVAALRIDEQFDDSFWAKVLASVNVEANHGVNPGSAGRLNGVSRGVLADTVAVEVALSKRDHEMADSFVGRQGDARLPSKTAVVAPVSPKLSTKREPTSQQVVTQGEKAVLTKDAAARGVAARATAMPTVQQFAFDAVTTKVTAETKRKGRLGSAHAGHLALLQEVSQPFLSEQAYPVMAGGLVASAEEPHGSGAFSIANATAVDDTNLKVSPNLSAWAFASDFDREQRNSLIRSLEQVSMRMPDLSDEDLWAIGTAIVSNVPLLQQHRRPHMLSAPLHVGNALHLQTGHVDTPAIEDNSAMEERATSAETAKDSPHEAREHYSDGFQAGHDGPTLHSLNSADGTDAGKAAVGVGDVSVAELHAATVETIDGPEKSHLDSEKQIADKELYAKPGSVDPNIDSDQAANVVSLEQTEGSVPSANALEVGGHSRMWNGTGFADQMEKEKQTLNMVADRQTDGTTVDRSASAQMQKDIAKNTSLFGQLATLTVSKVSVLRGYFSSGAGSHFKRSVPELLFEQYLDSHFGLSREKMMDPQAVEARRSYLDLFAESVVLQDPVGGARKHKNEIIPYYQSLDFTVDGKTEFIRISPFNRHMAAAYVELHVNGSQTEPKEENTTYAVITAEFDPDGKILSADWYWNRADVGSNRMVPKRQGVRNAVRDFVAAVSGKRSIDRNASLTMLCDHNSMTGYQHELQRLVETRMTVLDVIAPEGQTSIAFVTAPKGRRRGRKRIFITNFT